MANKRSLESLEENQIHPACFIKHDSSDKNKNTKGHAQPAQENSISAIHPHANPKVTGTNNTSADSTKMYPRNAASSSAEEDGRLLTCREASEMAQTSDFPPLGGAPSDQSVPPVRQSAPQRPAGGGFQENRNKRNRVQGAGWAAQGGSSTNRGRGSGGRGTSRGQGSRGHGSRGREVPPRFQKQNKPHPDAYGAWEVKKPSAWGNPSGFNTPMESECNIVGQPEDVGHSGFTFDASSISEERKKKPIDEVELKPEDIRNREGLLSTEPSGQSIIHMWSEFISKDEAQQMFETLADEINWNRRIITKPSGGTYAEPRKTFWFGELPYSYSRVKMESCSEWHQLVWKLKELIEKNTGHTYNSVLCNFYENAKDGVQWHSDDEFSLGTDPVIASVSLGATRKFQIRKKPNPPFVKDCDNFDQCEKYVIHLTSGSLLVMKGSMQRDWQHRVPKEYNDRDGRINLTFRTIYHEEESEY